MVQTQRKAPRRRRSFLSIRTLMIVGALIVLALATVHVVHGSGARTSAKRQSHHTFRVTCHTSRTHRKVCSHTVVSVRMLHLLRYHPSALERYQMQVMHVLDKHRHVFDRVAYSTSISTIGQLTSACSDFLTQISIMTDEVDGVPHPGAWYSAVDGFHRSVLQAYHDMASALEVCATGAGNGDGGSVATARQDLVASTRELHAVDDAAHRAWNRVHWLLQHPRRARSVSRGRAGK